MTFKNEFRLRRRRAREAWARSVRDALDSRGISLEKAAKHIGVTRNTLVSWLAADAEPNPYLLDRLAQVSGLSHALLLELLGVLPDEMAPAAYQLHASQELHRSLGEISYWVNQAIDMTDIDPAIQVTKAVMAQKENWELCLRPAFRGRRHRILQHTYVGLTPIHRPQLSNESAREEAFDMLSRTSGQTGVSWREQSAHDFPEHPSLLFQVPGQERPRGAVSHLHSSPSRIMVLGLPYAHAEFLASLMSEALGYGYADLRYGPEAPGLILDTTRRTEAMTRHAVHLLKGGRTRIVWSIADHKVLKALGGDLTSAQVPLTVVIQGGPALRTRGSQVWGVDERDMTALTEQLEGVVERNSGQVIEVAVPDEMIVEGGGVNADLLVDAMVDISLEVLEEIRVRYGNPDPTSWRGLPGQAWLRRTKAEASKRTLGA